MPHPSARVKAWAVVSCGLVDCRGITTCGNLAEETEGMGLVAAPGVRAREIEEASGTCARLLSVTDEDEGLAQLGEYEFIEEDTAARGHALPELFQEWE